jgi:hypothetical protein
MVFIDQNAQLPADEINEGRKYEEPRRVLADEVRGLVKSTRGLFEAACLTKIIALKKVSFKNLNVVLRSSII